MAVGGMPQAVETLVNGRTWTVFSWIYVYVRRSSEREEIWQCFYRRTKLCVLTLIAVPSYLMQFAISFVSDANTFAPSNGQFNYNQIIMKHRGCGDCHIPLKCYWKNLENVHRRTKEKQLIMYYQHVILPNMEQSCCRVADLYST